MSNEKYIVFGVVASLIHACDGLSLGPTTALYRGWTIGSSCGGAPFTPSAPFSPSHWKKVTPLGNTAVDPFSVCTILPSAVLPLPLLPDVHVARLLPQSAGAE